MGLSHQVLNFPALTIAAVFEALAAIKLFPNDFYQESHLKAIWVFLLGNWAFWALFWGFFHPRFINPMRNIPGPKSFIPTAQKSFMMQDRPGGELFLDMVKQYPNEPLLNLSAYGTQLFVSSPKVLSEILVAKCYEFVKPPKMSGFLRYVLGDGLIVLEGDPHKVMRKNTMPAFAFRHIKNLYPMMWQKSTQLANTLYKEECADGKDSGVIEISSWASKITLDIIGIAGLGRNFDTLRNQDDPLPIMYESLLEPSPAKLLFGVLCLMLGREPVRYLPLKTNKVFDDIALNLNKICRSLIGKKKEDMEKGDGSQHLDILSLLIKSGDFTDEIMKDQLLTFLAAGHETTSSAITWTSYLLSKHPEYQEKLRNEVEEALPGDPTADESIDIAAALESMPLLNGIMHETLRLYPTVPVTVREALHDTSLAGRAVPKGTMMVLSMWYMNRSPEFWGEDAAEFRPERWITDGRPNQNGGAASNYEFLTFLHGPRSCIGQGFARAEMRCLMAALIKTFSWELAMDEAKVIPKGVITSKAANGMYLKLTPLVKA